MTRTRQRRDSTRKTIQWSRGPSTGVHWRVQAFFVIRGGDEILEEAGTFSGQALLLSYPYPRGGGPVKEAGTHTALSTVPTQYQTRRNASTREGLTTASP